MNQADKSVYTLTHELPRNGLTMPTFILIHFQAPRIQRFRDFEFYFGLVIRVCTVYEVACSVSANSSFDSASYFAFAPSTSFVPISEIRITWIRIS